MKKGWEIKVLGEVSSTIMGQAPAGKDCNREGRGTPFVKAGEFGPFRPVIREWTTDPKKLAKSTDVLICVVGATCGKINLGADCAIGRSAAAIRPKAERLHQFFLHYFLEGQVQTLRTGSLGSAQTVISKDMIEAVEIALPPLEEQQRIVAILDESLEGLDRAYAHAQANLQSARELFESALGAGLARDAGGWRTAELKDLVESDCTLSYGIVQPGEEYPDGLPIVRPTDLGEREIGLSGLKRIDPAFASGYARTSLKGRDILLCVRGSTGVVAMASEELAGANVTRGIVPIRFNPKILKQRLGYFQFLSGPVQSQIRAGTYGAALMQINIRDLRLIKMLVPPLDQQDTVLERLENLSEQIDRTVLHYQLKLQQIIELRQSLMHKAFAGELT